MTQHSPGTGYIDGASGTYWDSMLPSDHLANDLTYHSDAHETISFIPKERPLIKRQEFLALALVGAGVACATFWSTVLLGPALLAWLGVSALAWLLPLLFPLLLCGVVYAIYRLGRFLSRAGDVNARRFPHYIFSRLTLIRASVSIGYGVALALAFKVGSAGLVWGGLWLPCVMVLGVYLLGRVIHRLAYHRRQMKPEVHTRARAARYMLALGAFLNGLAYLAITMAPATMPILMWLMPVCLPVMAALGIALVHALALRRLRQADEVLHTHHLAIQPYYSGIVIIATLLPYAMISAKAVMPWVMAQVGGWLGFVLGVATPVAMCAFAVGLGALAFRSLQVWWDHKLEALLSPVGALVGDPKASSMGEGKQAGKGCHHDPDQPFGTSVPALLSQLNGPATPEYAQDGAVVIKNKAGTGPFLGGHDSEDEAAYDADTEEGTGSEHTDDSTDGSDEEPGGTPGYGYQ